MTERRSLDLREAVPEPPDGLLELPTLHRKIRARRARQSTVAVLATGLAVAGIVLAVGRTGSGSAPAITQGRAQDGAIVFARFSPGRSAYLPNAALYATSPSGTQIRTLTAPSGQIGNIAASPDGREIAYDAETYGYNAAGKDWHVTGDYVHVVNADGSNNRTVYQCQSSTCYGLTWSPVGDRLIMNDSVVLEPDGHVDKLCSNACGPGDTLSGASWSPDGKQIAFEDSVNVTIHGGTATVSAIGTANADGTDITLLTNRQCRTNDQSMCTYDSSPAWSTNGDEIAFQRLRPNFLRLDSSLGLNPSGPTGVYTMSTNGSSITELAPCGSQCRVDSIQWAPDSDRLAYVSTGEPRIGNNAQSSVGVVDTATHHDDTITVTTVSARNDQSLVPAIAWAPTGGQLAIDNHPQGHPAEIDIIPVNHTTLGSPSVLIAHDAYPPITWLNGTP
jgi:dipeptidyl aminopeptidase/acylaminoacyl peptidase